MYVSGRRGTCFIYDGNTKQCVLAVRTIRASKSTRVETPISEALFAARATRSNAKQGFLTFDTETGPGGEVLDNRRFPWSTMDYARRQDEQ